MHPMQDLFLESFSYELQLDMHSYLHKKFILAKSGCYIYWVSYPTTLTKMHHVSTPMASRKSAALVMRPRRNSPLGRSQLT
jgi:hypothetical protein